MTYAYIHLPAPLQSGKPTLLFIHGFPATSHEWQPQIEFFSNQGYGILAPDCLGYGGTSRPLDVTLYVGKSMAEDIVAILKHENLKSVIGIAHDWGTYLLSNLVTWYEDRIEKLVFMSVGFSPPGRKLDVHGINRATKKKLGYELFGYQVFLASEGAGKIIGDHASSLLSFFHLIFPDEADIWGTKFAPLGGTKPSIESDELVPLAPYVSVESKAHHHDVFGNDYTAPCIWYRRGLDNVGIDEEISALKAGTIKQKLTKETLMLTGSKDKVCLSDKAKVGMNAVVEGGEKGGRLRVIDLEAGHWIMLEKAEETNRILKDFFEGKWGRSVL
ncbi:Alpha/Beta hydrolase protein [Bisporella sp. PMI_857]|nr:Alpha/Beta hydrolase protein [Bisporella sp. PMI_857]